MKKSSNFKTGLKICIDDKPRLIGMFTLLFCKTNTTLMRLKLGCRDTYRQNMQYTYSLIEPCLYQPLRETISTNSNVV